MSLEDRLYPLLSIYGRMPQPMRSAVGLCYRMLPTGWRYGANYPAFKALAEEGEAWDVDEIRDYQLKQVRVVLHHAANHCPFYQRTFARAGFRPEAVRTLEDLQHCPTIEKQDVQRNMEEMSSTEIRKSQRLYITTGGSTGAPVGFYLHKGVSRPKEQAFLDVMWKRAGYSPGGRVAVIRGHVTSSEAAGKIVSYDATRNWLLLSSYHLTAERLPEYLSAIEKFRPDFLHVYPSAALLLAEFLTKSGQAWRVPLKGLLCGSEGLTAPQKRLLEQMFNCRVFCWYGHSERVVLAGQGRRSDLFYFYPQYGFVEFGPPNEEGACEIIGTSFHNLAMPLIRYRTGDYAELADPRSIDALEFPWPVVSRIAGREHEFLVSATGRRISLTAFNMHDAIFDGLYAVQFFQAEPGVAEFRYVPAPSFSVSRLPMIEAAIRRKLGDDFAVELRQVTETEKTARGKHKWLVSKLAETARLQPLGR